jgi:RHS repeat-associated protein
MIDTTPANSCRTLGDCNSTYDTCVYPTDEYPNPVVHADRSRGLFIDSGDAVGSLWNGSIQGPQDQPWGCIASRAVYEVFANGKWISVESKFSDNFDPKDGNKYSRCKNLSPDVCGLMCNPLLPWCVNYEFDHHYDCAPPVMSLPVPSTPRLYQDGVGGVRAEWDAPKGCFLPASSSTYCDKTNHSCPSGQTCVIDTVDQFGGHCQPTTPQDCSATGATCPSGQTCLSREGEFDGYYLYVDDAAYSQERFNYYSMSPHAMATKDKSERTHTISGLRPGNFSVKVATFGRGGQISNASAPSPVVVPIAATGIPAPVSPKEVFWVNRDPATLHDAIKVKWQPGGTYSGLLGYRLWRSTNETVGFCALTIDAVTGTRTCKQSNQLGTSEVTTTRVWFSDDTVEKGVTYYYYVTALTGSGPSAASTTIQSLAVPYSDGVLSPPGSFMARAADGTKLDTSIDILGIYLTWCPNPEAEAVTGYRIYRSPSSRGPYRAPDGGGNNELIATVPPECLDTRHRCEITTTTLANPTVDIVPNTTCNNGSSGDCRTVDKSVSQTTDSSSPVYYYVATAIRTVDGTTSESAFSAENQGHPKYQVGGAVHDVYDPDNFPETICGIERASIETLPEEEQLAPYRIIGTILPSPNAVPRFLFYHLDHLGTPRMITTDTGAVVSMHHYLPFGEEMPVVAQGSTNRRQFTGHERDPEDGLDYMLARYYTAAAARFLAADTGGDTTRELSQSWNAYDYVHSNPMRSIDPQGTSVASFMDVLSAPDLAMELLMRGELMEFVHALDKYKRSAERFKAKAVNAKRLDAAMLKIIVISVDQDKDTKDIIDILDEALDPGIDAEADKALEEAGPKFSVGYVCDCMHCEPIKYGPPPTGPTPTHGAGWPWQ